MEIVNVIASVWHVTRDLIWIEECFKRRVSVGYYMQNDSNNLIKEALFMARKTCSQVVAPICY